MLSIQQLTLMVILAPLSGALLAGLCGKQLGVVWTHRLTIVGVLMACIGACLIDYQLFYVGAKPQVWDQYTWAESGSFKFMVGFLVDHLTAVMMTVVTVVSLLVHVYSMGYMAGDPGYQRFFSYMSLFTFAMLVLVSANNLFLLFFGWEAVGLVSYLLIGFWYHKPSAAAGGLKAFLVNRVGDIGMILGIALVLDTLGAVDYATVFAQSSAWVGHTIAVLPGHPWSIATVATLLLFVGAMGKSAQVPLHVWLPESMEGPTPISALIHAATMVTAGVYMVARLSPLFELSEVTLNVVLVVGATTAFWLGLVALVQTDIKKVVAYSTISQLGYMMAANGASAFGAAIFHLGTHACFKALLFLGAGSVICAMHHEQDMRKMGALWRLMPVTYVCVLIGSCALIALPPFAGYYSKDAIIEAVHLSSLPGAQYAYLCLLLGAFVTAFYTFRALFMTFHGPCRIAPDVRKHVHESPWPITVPLVLLAVPSLLLGAVWVEPMLYAKAPMLGSAVMALPQHDVLARMAVHFHGLADATFEAVFSAPFWLSLAGVATAYLAYVLKPACPAYCACRFKWVYQALVAKLGFDCFNDWLFVKGSKRLSQFFYLKFDMAVIDKWIVHGSARQVNRSAWLMRMMQTGYVYHYALVLVSSMVLLLCVVLYGQ